MITALDKKHYQVCNIYIMILYWYSYHNQYLYSIFHKNISGEKKIDESSPEVQRWGKLNK